MNKSSVSPLGAHTSSPLHRVMLSLLTLAVSALPGGVGVTNVENSTSGPVGREITPITYSPSIWAGYLDEGEKYTSISARWVVPTVTCNNPSNRWDVQWIGIDGGNGDGTVEQIGTEYWCQNGVGPPRYMAWWEMWSPGNTPSSEPGELTTPQYDISAGDLMSASINVVGTTWTLRIADRTQNWSHPVIIPSPHPVPNESTAEWVVERQVGLPDFHSTTFTDATVVGNGRRGSILEPSTIALEIANGSTVNVRPGPLSPSGTSFTDVWHAGWP